MNSFFTGLGKQVVRFRWPILIIWIVGTIAVATQFPSIGSQVNNNNSAFLPASSPSLKAQNLAIPIHGKENFSNQVYVAAVSQSGPLNASDQTTISAFESKAERTKYVVKVFEAATSPNGKAALINILASIDNFGPTQATTLINSLNKDALSVHAHSGLKLYVTGPLAIDVANNAKSQTSAGSLQTLSMLFIIALLLFIFRSLLAPFVTLFAPVVVLLLAGGIIGELGNHGLNVSQFTQLLMIVLLLGAGTDYGLFLVFRVREEMWSGSNPKEAVAHALSRVGESISASAGTVIFALLTLLFASFGIYKDLGIPLAIAVALMLLAGLTLLPAILAILGRAVFWPSKVRVGDHRKSVWGRTASQLVKKPAVTLTIGLVAFAALASFVSAYKSAGFGGAVTAPKGTAAQLGSQELASSFPHSASQPTDILFRFSTPIWGHPTLVNQIDRQLRASKLFTGIQGPLDPTGVVLSPGALTALHLALGTAKKLPPIEPLGLLGKIPPHQYNIYRATSQYISPEGTTLDFQVGLKAGDPANTPAMEEVPTIRSLTSSIAKDVGANADGVAGEGPGLYDVSSVSSHDLTHIIPIAALAITLLLAIVLRSLIAPLYLIISVIISYLAALGVSVLIFIEWRGDSGLTFLLPFLMFIFLLALGEDYNILVMTRIREEFHDLPLRQAVIKAVSTTGPTITSAGLVLAGSFAILAISAGNGPSSSQVQAIGLGLAIGILMDTFVVRTVLVPSVVSLLGRWNWWPSKLSHESHTSNLENIESEGLQDPFKESTVAETNIISSSDI